MANEIHAEYSSGSTLYFVVRDKAGDVWYAAGQVFESWGSDSRDADDYDIALADKSGSLYVGDFNGDIPSGRYFIQIFLQAGANPADTDTLLKTEKISWSGTGEITADKLLANKAVQDKSTGEIKYYDDDSQTVLLAHTPNESLTSITREPS